jgi:hypothetical protein
MTHYWLALCFLNQALAKENLPASCARMTLGGHGSREFYGLSLITSSSLRYLTLPNMS